MTYDIPAINKKGKPICTICGLGYDFLLAHVKKRHDMESETYRRMNNFHPRKSIVSESLSKLRRRNALKHVKTNYENLIIKGQYTRFKEGNTATPVELLREVNSKRMKKYWKDKRMSQMSRFTDIISKLEEYDVLRKIAEIKARLGTPQR